MGTNYYAVKKGKKLNWLTKRIRIGKSSLGWRFLFRASKELPHSYKEMFKVLRDEYDIYDEYERLVSIDDLIELIEVKQFNEENKSHIGLDGRFKFDKDGYEFVEDEFS